MENIERAKAIDKDQIVTSRSTLAHLLQAILNMAGEIAESRAVNIGANIKDAHLYDSSGGEYSLSELLDCNAAIIAIYDGNMCQSRYEELMIYNDILSTQSEKINMIVITNNSTTAASCRVSEVMDEGMEIEAAMLKDKNNLQFDLEVEGNIPIEEELPKLYKLMSDSNNNFTEEHKLTYTISQEIKDIFISEFGIRSEEYFNDDLMVIPAIYIVNNKGVISYASTSCKLENRPSPAEVVDIFKHIIS